MKRPPIAAQSQSTNVLLTCVGRRNYLVRFFREALGASGQIFAADTVDTAPALHEADGSFLLPPLDHPTYVDRLFALCQQHGVRLIVPLHDRELPLLAEHRARFLAAGIRAVVSAPPVIAICDDKWETFRFFQRQGLDVAPSYCTLANAQAALAAGEIQFPLVIKPRRGSASMAVHVVENQRELALAYELTTCQQARTTAANETANPAPAAPLIQQHITGQEYGLDVINDLDGRHVATVIKRKLLMRAGETDRARTAANDRLEQLGAVIGQQLKHIGNLDCDVFVTDTKCYVIDMNPRFGGGYPFSHAAGLRLPSALIAWANGTAVDPAWFDVRPGVLAAKYDTLATVESGSFRVEEAPTDIQVRWLPTHASAKIAAAGN